MRLRYFDQLRLSGKGEGLARRQRDLSDVLEGNERRLFVGRESEQRRFKEMLATPPASPDYRFVYAISGPSGSGKTWLLRRLAEHVRSLGGRPGLAEQTDIGPIEAMRHLARDLQHKRRFDKFLSADRSYQELRSRVANDPAAPDGLASMFGRAASKSLMVAAKEFVPGAPTALGFVNSDAVVEQGEEVAQYLAAKFKRREERRLVHDPVGVLTPMFAEGLRKSALRAGTPLVLCFDGFEHTGGLLDGWLRRLLGQEYGRLPAHLFVVIAGQRPLSLTDWSRFAGLLERSALGDLSVDERAQYLSRTGRDAMARRLVSQLPGLPAAFVASTSREQLGEVGGDMADSLLSVAVPSHRELLLEASLPRFLNKDILGVLGRPRDSVGEEWEWLRGRSYVEETTQGWIMHPSARTALLARLFKESPTDATRLSSVLGTHYGDVMAAREGEKAASLSRKFRNATAEHIYHRLCEDYEQGQPQAVTIVAGAMASDQGFAYQLATAVEQAEVDLDLPSGERWGTDLRAAASDGDDWMVMIRGLSRLLGADLEISETTRVSLLNGRASMWSRLHYFERAVDDLDQALSLRGESPFLLARRARAKQRALRWADSLEDVEAAFAMVPEGSGSIRAQLFDAKARAVSEIEGFGSSVRWWSEAIAAAPGASSLRMNRAVAYKRDGRFDEAVADLGLIKSDPSWSVEVEVMLAEIRFAAGSGDTLLADLKRTVEHHPESSAAWLTWAWNLAERGWSEEAAVAELYSAQVNDTPAVSGCRAAALQGLAPAAGLKELQSVIGDRSPTAEEWNQLGLACARLGDLEGAVRRYKEGLALQAHSVPLSYNRAVAATRAGMAEAPRYRQALTELLQRPQVDQLQASFARAGLAAQDGDTTEALTLLDQAVRLDRTAADWIAHDIAWDGLRDDLRLATTVDEALSKAS
jgi:tetratricopeptide (TPR) repeat protein